VSACAATSAKKKFELADLSLWNFCFEMLSNLDYGVPEAIKYTSLDTHGSSPIDQAPPVLLCDFFSAFATGREQFH
jgi:hypothetical protein